MLAQDTIDRARIQLVSLGQVVDPRAGVGVAKDCW